MGRGRRRTWRKLHLGADETTKEIFVVDLTTSGVHDSPYLPTVLDQIADAVGQVSGARAYDSGTCYEAILAHGATPTILPRRNARFTRAKDLPPLAARMFENQRIEALVKSEVLNRMASLGMPRPERVLQG